MSGFDQQTGALADRLNEPEVTPQDAVAPGFWGGLSPVTPLRGVAAGAMETGSVLAQGLPGLARFTARGTLNPVGIGLSEPAQKAWEQPIAAWANQVADSARAGAKVAMPDPRLTGSAANLVFGASKVLTEAGLMTAVAGGNPVAGAFGLGGVQGVARYRDFKDQGVDDTTAVHAALIEGGAATLGMLAPVGLPARWLADLTPARQLLTQLATGAASNVGQGVAARYATHKILEDAGYPALAEQSKAFDGEAILSDMVSGAGFGGMHYLNQRPELAEQARALASNDGTLRDAARVMQNDQEVNERAPGVPVDYDSQAVHRAALEKATTDLLEDKPVDVGEIADHGEFARQAEHTQDVRQMMHEEFIKAGVFDESAKLEDLNRVLDERYEPPPIKPRERTLEMPDETGKVNGADEQLTAANDEAARVKDEAPKLFQAAADCAGRVA